MAKLAIRDRVMEEIKLIPEHKLSEIYNFIHYFRIGLQGSKGNLEQIMKFAGCWKDMSEDAFNDLLREISKRRKQAFSQRRSGEASTG
jgi:hypothetical protein